MDILQMKCFLSLVKTRKLTETANFYNLRVSTLSKYMDHLAAELSVELFKKSANELELTKEGHHIYPSIQLMVKQYDDMKLDLNQLINIQRTTLSVSVAYHQFQMLQHLLSFTEQYPDINMMITENPTSSIRTMLDAKSIDVAVTYEELLEKKYPYALPLYEDKLVAIVGRKHPLADKECISISELEDDTFFLYEGDSLFSRFQIHTCIAAGFRPKRSHHEFYESAITKYVAQNQGVSLLARDIVHNLKEDISILPLKDDIPLTLSLVFPGLYLTEPCRKLADFLRLNAFESTSLPDVPLTSGVYKK